MRELMQVLELKGLSHEDLNNHYCVDWLKAHFSREKTLEAAALTGIPKRSIIGPVNYRHLKEFGSPGLIVEPPKHRMSVARIRVAIPAQLRAVEKLLEPKSMGLPDTAYMARLCRRIHDMENLMEAHSWLRRWQPTIARTLEPQEWSLLQDRISMEHHRSCFGQKR